MSSSLRGLLWTPGLEEALFISTPTLISMAWITSSSSLFICFLLCYHIPPTQTEAPWGLGPHLFHPPISPGLEDTHSIKIGLTNTGSIITSDYMSTALLKALHLPQYILIKNPYERVVIIFSTSYSWLPRKPEMKTKPAWYLSCFSLLPSCSAVLWGWMTFMTK